MHKANAAPERADRGHAATGASHRELSVAEKKAQSVVAGTAAVRRVSVRYGGKE